MSPFEEATTSKGEPYKDVEYMSLSDTSSGHVPPKQHSISSRILLFLGGSASMFFCLLFIVLAQRALTSSPKTAAQIESEDWNYCGRSSKTAMEKGCVMEPLFYGWMPKQCAWRELSDKFPVFEDRKWYYDINMTRVIPSEELWNGKNVVIHTPRYHGEHCLFQWRKLQYAMINHKEFLDNKTISDHHEEHCADQMSEGCEKPDDINVVSLGFYRCRKTIW